MVRHEQTSAITSYLDTYFTDRLSRYGATHRGLDWNSAENHALHHQQFLFLLRDDYEASIGDLGCGYGDFLGYLRERGFTGRFIGYDLNQGMIAAARQYHGQDDRATWYHSATPTTDTDYVIASGIFNLRGSTSDSDWESYMESVIEAMAARARKGFAFNVLTRHSDPEKRRADLYYADPGTWLDFCARRYGRHLALLQDYGLWDFTLIVRKAV